MIKVEHLKVRFGQVDVLKDININIGKGEIIALIGPSGTGKSAFLRCLNFWPSLRKVRSQLMDLL